ncbi:sugar transferase [bacterium]|nr:sugar transferase [bacterium]
MNIDRAFAILLLPLILPALAVLYVLAMLLQGRPFIYSSERMRDADTSFRLFKIRTMRPPGFGEREGALGGHLEHRVTPMGVWLRRLRLDELPQIFNVIRGDIRFIGPRPPLRKHVEACPRRYRQLLALTRPGITGLATVMVHAREERLLSACRSEEETEVVYLRRCLPVKLRLDMIYQRKRSPILDLLVLWRTFAGLSQAVPIDQRNSSVTRLRPVLWNA